jgi:SAM-dependent methyltransferase
MNDHGKIIYSHIDASDTVLDLGCGILQEFGYKPPVNKYLGVDAFDPYLRKIADQGVMTVRGKLPDFCESFLDSSWDVVLLIDVIEHLTKDDGFKVLDHVERIAKKCVIIDTPNGFEPQKGWAAWNLPHCDLQEHLSGWTDKEFNVRGYSTLLIGKRPQSCIATRYTN